MLWFAKKTTKPESPSSPQEPVLIKTFADRYEAEIVAGLLDARDIPSYISADDIGETRPYLIGLTGGVRLFVRRDHAETALRLLAEFENEGDIPEDIIEEYR